MFANRMIRSLAAFLTIVQVSTALGAPQTPAQDPVKFKDKLVLALPVINATGEKWQEMKTRVTAETAKAINSELSDAKFSLVADVDVKTLLEAPPLSLSDEESWRRDTFFDLGQRANAEYVVFAVITQATQRQRMNLFSAVPEGEVTLKVWVLNAKTRTALVSAKSFTAKARSKTNLFGEAKGSDCQVQAAKRAVKEAFKEAFKPKE